MDRSAWHSLQKLTEHLNVAHAAVFEGATLPHVVMSGGDPRISNSQVQVVAAYGHPLMHSTMLRYAEKCKQTKLPILSAGFRVAF